MECSNLQTLYVDFNKLEKIEYLSNVPKLQKLYLNNNKITSIKNYKIKTYK